jgi:hypothetical protein
MPFDRTRTVPEVSPELISAMEAGAAKRALETQMMIGAACVLIVGVVALYALRRWLLRKSRAGAVNAAAKGLIVSRKVATSSRRFADEVKQKADQSSVSTNSPQSKNLENK